MFKRGDVWWTCIRQEGRKIQQSLETTDKKLARAIEAKILTELVEGKYFDKPKGNFVTVDELIDKYLSDHSKPNKALQTYRCDISFSKKILKSFGKMRLAEVSPKHLAAYVKKRRGNGVSNTTIHHELQLLRHAYNLAIKQWELADNTPFAKFSIPKGDVKRVRYLSKEEEKLLMEALPDWLEPMVIVARETGLRLSNVTNLKWSQVNLFNKTIIIETTKNGEPIGLPMTNSVHSTLKDLNRVRRIDSDYIFGKDGKPFTHWWVSRSFHKTCQQAGIENLRFHDLRHDFCSRLVQRGVDLYTVATLVGHKDIKMTQRYAHLSPEKLRVAVKVLDSDYNLTTVNKKGLESIL